jgi:hypothetical protein
MQKTKLIIAITAIAALTLAAVGLAAAQIAQNQTYIGTQAPPNSAVPDQSLWGWIGNCFGYRTAQPYQEQYIAPPAPTNNSSAPQPAPYQPNQGSYDGYGYGPCMGGW